MNEYNYDSAKKLVASWVEDTIKEVEAQGRKPLSGEGDPTSKHPGTTSHVRLGGALILFCVQQNEAKEYEPVCIVTELAPRKHKIGIGHHHTYAAMASGTPNYKKMVRNAVDRADEIDALRINYDEHLLTTASCAERQKDELGGMHLPPEIVLQRYPDGNYCLHISTMRVGLDTIREVLPLLKPI